MQVRVVIFSILFLIVSAVMLMQACRKKDSYNPTPLAFVNPPGWPAIQYDFSQNPLSQEGFDLGRKLFYDGTLSKDGNYPCASCHQQVAAFGTYDHDRSHGYNNAHTLRNAPSLQNLAWLPYFDWDGGYLTIEDRIIAHINHPGEMGETTAAVLAKLSTDPNYPSMFKAAFGDQAITAERLSKALAQFVLSMVSANSKYDKVMRGESSFNLPEQLGYDIFNSKCASCHTAPLFTDNSFRNIGLTLNPVLQDKGRMRITNSPADSLKFRVPSLRNVQVTYTYGHDGRFFVVDNVLEHYRSGVQNGPTTDPIVKNYIPLSNFEIGQLKAFMNALTDSTIMKDARFSKP